MKLFIMHPGKAHYPEIDAYTAYFRERGFEVASGRPDDHARLASPVDWVLWCIMGFYRTARPARLVIHDYRSLSVGRFARAKDWLKHSCQHRPDLRLFQNERLRDELGFRDGVPSLLLPMGVPDWIFELARGPVPPGPAGRFCYIGEMSFERGFDKLLRAYRDYRRSTDDTLMLVGEPDPRILARFAHVPGLTFAGRLPQRDALRVVARSDYAVCYFPTHRPHCYQTPTKLLEYAALGKPILCNGAAASVALCQALGIHCHAAGRAIFDGLATPLRLVLPNDPARLQSLRWGTVIDASGVAEWLRSRATHGGRQ
ncbi:glycosyltransferase [Burkholderia stagnalis]|uniref:glycosyltransferase n=1 Tax=Burkholderia stagnalis TaxID=1503054 RepID=UPI0007521348|nr:glycosyltransferase [Burkholderia stagnalis]KVD93276.1 glycosyltransferase [Burkholderia stagnalis]KVO52813.1 glycosyltransferase [Burkholderia stagnalis]KVP06894.1 glycosyltransferase [Burkholderia stagnalis]KVW97681.1 glycosyltransferase [Burkholderia stagnalis]KWH83348.1 glycosyltransferase [Burkholderia stagnalis]